MKRVERPKRESDEESLLKYKKFLSILFKDVNYSENVQKYLLDGIEYFNIARTTITYDVNKNLETLEKVGDKLLASCVAIFFKQTYLEKFGHDMKPSQLSYIDNYFSNNVKLAEIAEHLNLTQFVKGVISSNKVKADVIEAFLAAIYYASNKHEKMGTGFENVYKFVSYILNLENFKIDITDENKYKPAITKVYEYFEQKNVKFVSQVEYDTYIATFLIQSQDNLGNKITNSYSAESNVSPDDAKKLAAMQVLESNQINFDERMKERKEEKVLSEKGYKILERDNETGYFAFQIGDTKYEMKLNEMTKKWSDDDLIMVKYTQDKRKKK